MIFNGRQVVQRSLTALPRLQGNGKKKIRVKKIIFIFLHFCGCHRSGTIPALAGFSIRARKIRADRISSVANMQFFYHNKIMIKLSIKAGK